MAVMIPWGRERGRGALVAIREADAFFMASGKFESALSSLFGGDMG